MKTQRPFRAFGIFIPAGYPLQDTDSCAVVARYDESKGCAFEKGCKLYVKPNHNTPVAVPRSYMERDEPEPLTANEKELERVIDESRYQ